MASVKPKNDVTFGEAMGKLEQVVRQLEEDESMGLEQALALYEQGAALAGDLQARLGAAKLRLTEIDVPPIAAERDA